MPAGFSFEHSTAGATLAVVVGRLSAATQGTLRAYKAVLWLVDSAGRASWPAGLSTPATIVDLPVAGQTTISDALDGFVRRDPRCLPTVLVTQAAAVDPSCPDVLGQINTALRSIRTARVTRQLDGFPWQKHLLSNLENYVRHRLPATWAGALAGCPAVICAAGPSLDVTAPLLKNSAHRAVIFSADSALGALARQGVAADFAVTVDVSKVPDKCLAGVTDAPRWLLMANLSPPVWSQAPLKDGRFFCSSRQVTVDWLAGLGVSPTAVPVGDNCGATALALARFLGCSPIYLFGMDQALDEHNQQRRHHQAVSADLYSQSGFKADTQHPRVPGNYAPTVPTHIEADWQSLNDTLVKWPQGLVYNVIDRGARLTNTTLVAPADWVLPEGGGTKAGRLASLRLTELETAQVEPVLARVRGVASAHLRHVERVAAEVGKAGPAYAQQAFRELLKDDDFARLMGAFSLKLMPHLFPPVTGDNAFWQTMAAECLELTRLAAGTPPTAGTAGC